MLDGLYGINLMYGYNKIRIDLSLSQHQKGGKSWLNRWYAVSTVGFEENKIRDYIRHQERLDDEEDAGRF